MVFWSDSGSCSVPDGHGRGVSTIDTTRNEPWVPHVTGTGARPPDEERHQDALVDGGHPRPGQGVGRATVASREVA